MNDDLDSIEITKTQFEVLPAGIYPVTISKITKVQSPVYGKPEEMETKLNVEFSIIEGDHSGKKLFRRMRTKLASGSKPSTLFTLWKATEGKELTAEEMENFHLSNMLGRFLKVVVDQVEKNGKKFNNITAFWPLETK